MLLMPKTVKASVRREVQTKSDIGSISATKKHVGCLYGYLTSKRGEANSVAEKLVEQSTHTFFSKTIGDVRVNDTLEVLGKVYKVDYVDNPGNVNHHLEVYLTYTGGD
jgi:hypothetical protein